MGDSQETPGNRGADSAPWIYSARSTAVRLFLTCWIVYALHFATNIVREVYPAISIGEHLSFRLDEYANLHPDIFEMPGRGWHINNNPGVSMMAAVPYAAAGPLINRVVGAVQSRRAAAGLSEPPAYDSPWPMAREFYRRAWQSGLDIKLGLAGAVTQIFFMAPLSALGIVGMFFGLRRILSDDRRAFWLAMVYAFGTPVFFRTGYLNHNMAMGHIVFLGFLSMWERDELSRETTRKRYFLGGLAGGAAYLLDNSGVILLLCLFGYGLAQAWYRTSDRRAAMRRAIESGFWYFLGTLGPVGLLWFYQWRSFGHPLYPAQHWMPKVAWIEMGYQGLTLPSAGLLMSLLFDYRYGLFISCPLFLLAAFVYVMKRDERARRAGFEIGASIIFFLAMLLFCSGVQYARLQFNTGIRYLAPVFPFIFIPAALTLIRLPRRAAYFIAVFSVALGWCQAMYRDVERGLGVLDPALHVFIGGFQLPAMTTISRLGKQFGEYTNLGVSPLPAFLLLAAVIYGIWAPRPLGFLGRQRKERT